jgi:hypothetical protein
VTADPRRAPVESAAELARRGDVEAALAALRAALEAENSAAQSALLEPAFELRLRSDDRFRAPFLLAPWARRT